MQHAILTMMCTSGHEAKATLVITIAASAVSAKVAKLTKMLSICLRHPLILVQTKLNKIYLESYNAHHHMTECAEEGDISWTKLLRRVKFKEPVDMSCNCPDSCNNA